MYHTTRTTLTLDLFNKNQLPIKAFVNGNLSIHFVPYLNKQNQPYRNHTTQYDCQSITLPHKCHVAVSHPNFKLDFL
jgi:hypothetical protein